MMTGSSLDKSGPQHLEAPSKAVADVVGRSGNPGLHPVSDALCALEGLALPAKAIRDRCGWVAPFI